MTTNYSSSDIRQLLRQKASDLMIACGDMAATSILLNIADDINRLALSLKERQENPNGVA